MDDVFDLFRKAKNSLDQRCFDRLSRLTAEQLARVIVTSKFPDSEFEKDKRVFDVFVEHTENIPVEALNYLNNYSPPRAREIATGRLYDYYVKNDKSLIE